MKVLHVVPYYPPHRLGGVGEFVAGLHGALLAAGHTSEVLTCGPSSGPGVRAIAGSAKTWFVKAAFAARHAADFDVVHCQGGEAVSLLLALSVRRRRPKILATFHVHYAGIADSFRPYSIDGRSFAGEPQAALYRSITSRLHRIIDRVTIRLADGVNTISRQGAIEILDDDADAASVIYYGLEDLAPGAEEDPSITSVDLLYAGLGSHRKRVVMLPSVLERVRTALPEARLRIVGFSPRSEPELHRLFEERGLAPHVEYAGVKRSEELPAYYAKAGALVVPSAYEGLPLVILEALRSGLPVVATRVSGHPEAIDDGVNGFLVDLDDADRMAERCVRILADRALRRRMSEAARRTVQSRFTMDRQLREYVDLYRALADGDDGATPPGA